MSSKVWSSTAIQVLVPQPDSIQLTDAPQYIATAFVGGRNVRRIRYWLGALVAGVHPYHALQTISAVALFMVGKGLDGDVVAFGGFA